MMDDDLWYSDELDVDGKVSDMARRTRITLVDFGFARALGPRDIDEDIGLRKIADERRGGSSSTTATAAEAGDHGECVFVVGHPSCCSIDRALEDATSHGGGMPTIRYPEGASSTSVSFFVFDSIAPIYPPPPRPFFPAPLSRAELAHRPTLRILLFCFVH
jgi:hypothetical protein